MIYMNGLGSRTAAEAQLSGLRPAGLDLDIIQWQFVYC